jgi:glycine/D-amino acid oxidase-like deaminating enzyme/nitrite reductase/ring-hydroxylating ferredoxin subunit
MDIERPTHSIWMDNSAVPDFSEVTESFSCDVAIIGAGITGLLSAYRLLKEGRTVSVIDDGDIAGGNTERTTAHLTTILDWRYFELEEMHGTDKARQVARSHETAINWLESLITEERIDCDFSRLDGHLFINPIEEAEIDDLAQKTEKATNQLNEKIEELNKELAALERAGIDGVTIQENLPAWGQSVRCIKIGNQAQFQVLDFIAGLVAAIVKMGGRLYCHTHITEIKDGDEVELSTANGRTIKAANVIVATNSPVSNSVAIHTKLAAYRSYAISAQIPDTAYSQGLFWDTDDPYHYIRCQYIGDKLYVIVGGEDHRTGQSTDYDKAFDRLEVWARALISDLGPVEYRWSGQVYEPTDGLPYIGRDPNHSKNIYVATGMSGVGMAEGALAAIILGDMIAERENEWQELYAPTRKTIGALGEYIKENISTASQYLELLSGTPTKVADIPPGEGAVLSNGLNKTAAYKCETGAVINCNAICPHLKAVVRWNTIEKSWDCPAHGSRFDSSGVVLDGPANANLSSAEMEADRDSQMAVLHPHIPALE